MIQSFKPEDRHPPQDLPDRVLSDDNREVLVIDDRLENRLLLQRVLTQFNYRVETAVDGEQAWRKLLQRSFQFIVTDYEMPNLDGLKLIGRIRRCSSSVIRRCPIILHSAIDNASLRRAVRRDERTYFFPKPLDVRRLAKLLQQLPRRRKGASQKTTSPPRRPGRLRLTLPMTNFRTLMPDL